MPSCLQCGRPFDSLSADANELCPECAATTAIAERPLTTIRVDKAITAEVPSVAIARDDDELVDVWRNVRVGLRRTRDATTYLMLAVGLSAGVAIISAVTFGGDGRRADREFALFLVLIASVTASAFIIVATAVAQFLGMIPCCFAPLPEARRWARLSILLFAMAAATGLALHIKLMAGDFRNAFVAARQAAGLPPRHPGSNREEMYFWALLGMVAISVLAAILSWIRFHRVVAADRDDAALARGFDRLAITSIVGNILAVILGYVSRSFVRSDVARLALSETFAFVVVLVVGVWYIHLNGQLRRRLEPD